MPIKKSELEQKWYYRVARVFFLILPPLAAVVVFLTGKIDISAISQKTILDILQKNTVSIAYIAGGLVLYFLTLTAIWRIFLYIAFGGLEDDTVKKANEVAQPVNQAAQTVAPLVILLIVFVIAFLFQMGYIKLPRMNLNPEPVIIHTYGAPCTTSEGKTGLYGTNGNCYTCSDGTAATNPINNNCSNGIAGVYCCGTGNNGDDGCIATGCGSMWYCSGSYYIGGQEITVPGLCFPTHPNNVYPSWIGVCRQCP